MLRHYDTVLPSSTDLGAMAGRQGNRLCLIRAQVGPRGGIAPGHGQVEKSHGKETASRDSAIARLGTGSVPAVPGVPEPLPTGADADDERGHGPGAGVPSVPALSNSLSPCPNAKSGSSTLGWLSLPSVLQPLFGLRWRAISRPLEAVIRGLSRLLKVGVMCCSRCIIRTELVDSQADIAGSIPVIRSTWERAASAIFSEIIFVAIMSASSCRVPAACPFASARPGPACPSRPRLASSTCVRSRAEVLDHQDDEHRSEAARSERMGR